MQKELIFPKLIRTCFICQTEVVLIYWGFNLPNCSLRVFNPQFLICGFLLYCSWYTLFHPSKGQFSLQRVWFQQQTWCSSSERVKGNILSSQSGEKWFLSATVFLKWSCSLVYYYNAGPYTVEPLHTDNRHFNLATDSKIHINSASLLWKKLEYFFNPSKQTFFNNFIDSCPRGYGFFSCFGHESVSFHQAFHLRTKKRER